MLFDFIAAAAAGFGIAGIAMLLRHLTRGLLPRWIVPLAAGVGMFGYAVWNEYSWFDRVTGAFAEGVEVVVAPTESQFYRPWTYIKPLTLRFVAWDGVNVLRSTEKPGLVQGDAVIVHRWQPTLRVRMGFDCVGGQQVTLVEGATLAPDGTLTNAQWQAAAANDPMQRVACQGG